MRNILNFKLPNILKYFAFFMVLRKSLDSWLKCDICGVEMWSFINVYYMKGVKQSKVLHDWKVEILQRCWSSAFHICKRVLITSIDFDCQADPIVPVTQWNCVAMTCAYKVRHATANMHACQRLMFRDPYICIWSKNSHPKSEGKDSGIWTSSGSPFLSTRTPLLK